MGALHLFESLGDSCPICDALDGQEVEPGYRPHPGCLCQTHPAEHLGDCEWTFESEGTTRTGNGWHDFTAAFSVWVKCPDGTVVGQSLILDGTDFADFNDYADRLEDELEAAAQDICDDCATGEDEPFLCC